MSEFENKDLPELPQPTEAELVDLAVRGEFSIERLELEADWLATQKSAAEQAEKREQKRLNKQARKIARIALRRNR